MTFTMTPQDVYWMGKAEDAIRDDGFKFWMVGGGVGAVGAGAILNPLVGVFVAGASLMQSWAANEASSNDLDAIDRGIVAHLLGQRDFEEYLEYRGVDGVLWELMEAQRRKLEIKPAGRKFLKGQLGQKTLVEQAKALVAPTQTSTPAPKPEAVEAPQTTPAPITAQWEPVSTPPAPTVVQSWDEDPTPVDAHSILMECLAYPCILIYGPQGSGKSTLAKWLISQRLQAGHKVEILDPHAAYGAWPGLAVYGAGMDYQACNQRLLAFADMVRARYTELASRPDYNPKPLTVLTEEFTNWSSHCDAAGDYFASTLSDIRKINMMAVYVAHGRTLASLGGKAGAAAQRDQSLLEIEMLGTIGPGGKAIPSGMCRIYYPGRKNEPIEVAVPQFDPSEMTPPPVLPEVKELILAILEVKGNAPMLASEIRQQSAALKKLTTDQVAFTLDRMATDDGFVVSDGGSPARYQIPNDVGHLALDT
jgi:hypothetical protein